MHQSCRTFGNLTKEMFVKKLAEKNAIPMHPRLSKAPSNMSVLIPLLDVKSTPSVLFTKRSIHLKSHRGEVCFPGGRMEDGESAEEAALRETHEEIGVEPKSVEIWGRLKPVFTRTMTTTVVPIVGCIAYDALKTEHVNKREVILFLNIIMQQNLARNDLMWVQTLFSVPLEELCRSTGYTRFLSKKAEYALPVFFSKNFTVISHNTDEFLPREFRIWGLSAIMLHQLLLIILS
ncbi:hydrolase, NUDIX family [Ostertagia ostertagi]